MSEIVFAKLGYKNWFWEHKGFEVSGVVRSISKLKLNSVHKLYPYAKWEAWVNEVGYSVIGYGGNREEAIEHAIHVATQ